MEVKNQHTLIHLLLSVLLRNVSAHDLHIRESKSEHDTMVKFSFNNQFIGKFDRKFYMYAMSFYIIKRIRKYNKYSYMVIWLNKWIFIFLILNPSLPFVQEKCSLKNRCVKPQHWCEATTANLGELEILKIWTYESETWVWVPVCTLPSTLT
jgi:hypothetical protein